jgi:hypothetical protein
LVPTTFFDIKKYIFDLVAPLLAPSSINSMVLRAELISKGLGEIEMIVRLDTTSVAFVALLLAGPLN